MKLNEIVTICHICFPCLHCFVVKSIKSWRETTLGTAFNSRWFVFLIRSSSKKSSATERSDKFLCSCPSWASRTRFCSGSSSLSSTLPESSTSQLRTFPGTSSAAHQLCLLVSQTLRYFFAVGCIFLFTSCPWLCSLNLRFRKVENPTQSLNFWA